MMQWLLNLSKSLHNPESPRPHQLKEDIRWLNPFLIYDPLHGPFSSPFAHQWPFWLHMLFAPPFLDSSHLNSSTRRMYKHHHHPYLIGTSTFKNISSNPIMNSTRKKIITISKMKKLELHEVKKSSSKVTKLLSRRARFDCKVLDPNLL